METFVLEWLNLLLRWAHVLVAIAWIGHAFFFNMLDASLNPPDESEKDKVEGEVWMVHGGGFYLFRKTLVLPKVIKGRLVWFKWEAGFTWITGFLLLCVVYYLGGGVLMTDPTVSNISTGTAIGVGLGSLVLAWLLYDAIWVSPLRRNHTLAVSISIVLYYGLIFALSHIISGRATFMHAGAVLATLMAFNVWVRIIPALKEMVAATKEGKRPDYTLGALAKQRSRHNNYMTFPVVFVMISNHFPTLYGHKYNWLLLILLMSGAAGIRHYMNMRHVEGRDFSGRVGALMGLCGLALLLAMTFPRTHPSRPQPARATQTGATPIDVSQLGEIVGTVRFQGEVPPPKEVILHPGCQEDLQRPVLLQTTKVKGDKLADVFVYIKSGYERWTTPPVPDDEVVVDQRGCLYEPHVLGARVGQKVTFVNDDPVFHNVRSIGTVNDTFNLIMPSKDMRITRTFLQPEIMIRTRCDVHPWMNAYLGIVDHPWFAVSDDNGRFTIENVPPGTYTLEAWHETQGKQTLSVKVPPKGSASIEFVFGKHVGREK